MTHAVDLPELTDHISSFLTNKSLSCCIRVSHQWQSTFYPCLWRRIQLHTKKDLEDFRADHLKSIRNLQEHLDLIQHLTLFSLRDNTAPTYLSMTFPRLQELHLGFGDPNLELQARIQAGEFMRRQGDRLRSLTIRNMRELTRTPEKESFRAGWDILQGCHQGHGCLKSLRLHYVVLDFDKMDPGSRELLMGLEILKLINFNFVRTIWTPLTVQGWERQPAWPKRLTGSKVKRLEMRRCYPIADELQLLEDCQELRSLVWDYSRHNSTTKGQEYQPPLAQGLREGRWRFLESLELKTNSKIGGNNLSDEGLAEIIDAIGPLRELRLDKSEFSTRSVMALLGSEDGKHRSKIETLSLWRCPRMTSSSVQRMLCELPNLKHIQVPVLMDVDVKEDPRPWVCLGLREFHCSLVFTETVRSKGGEELEMDLMSLEGPPSPSPSSTVFLDRLASLRSLQVLRMASSMSAKSCVYQKLKLEHGLDQLASLKALKVLRMEEGTDQMMDLEEAGWMVQHWPRLRKVDISRSNPSKETRKKLCQFFREHGIACH